MTCNDKWILHMKTRSRNKCISLLLNGLSSRVSLLYTIEGNNVRLTNFSLVFFNKVMLKINVILHLHVLYILHHSHTRIQSTIIITNLIYVCISTHDVTLDETLAFMFHIHYFYIMHLANHSVQYPDCH